MSSPSPVPAPREHVASPDCWCNPVEAERGVWVHRKEGGGYLLHQDYVPDIKGVIEGDEV